MSARTVPGGGGPELRIVPSLDSIGREQWDTLIGPDNFYNSHAWLRGLELAFGTGDIVTAFRDGTLLGALPTWPGEGDTPGLFCLPQLFPGLFPEAGADRSADYLWLGARRSVFNELVCVHGVMRGVTLGVLLRGALELADSRGATGVVMPYLPTDDARDLARAHPGARALLHDADANLNVPAGGFAEHLARTGQRDRTRRRAELRACAHSGTTVEWHPLDGENAGQAARLVTQTRARYGGSADVGWMERSFAAQLASGALRRAIGCFGVRGGRPVAVTICYAHDDRLYARYYGFDYRKAEPACEYFVLTYCAALDYAAAYGFRRYRLAVSAPEIKVRRGATLSPLAAVLLPLGTAICTPERAAAVNARTVRRWRARCPTRPWATGPEWDTWDPVS
ncbi:peptidogalycan biosysnthesis protein [Streptomyces celluloflavus]|uniref:peptidogalycan biosysnthesis protein n=1 Tax=Streptomyces celluloflavus TaxID=58344 RepID=UPI0036B2ECB6